MSIRRLNMWLILLLLLIPNIVNAEYLGCKEPSEPVEGPVQFSGVTGESAATSISMRVFDPDDGATPSFTITSTCGSPPCYEAVDATNALGLYRYKFTLGATPLAGTWIVRSKGTIDGNVQPGTDTLYVVDTAGDCASRTGVVTASGTVTTVTNGVTLANDAITAAKIQDGTLGAAAETYLATGTENASYTSTATRVYTAISNNTRRYMSMCLENGTTGERSKIVGYGSSPANYYDVRGFSAAVGDSVTLNVHTTGCQ